MIKKLEARGDPYSLYKTDNRLCLELLQHPIIAVRFRNTEEKTMRALVSACRGHRLVKIAQQSKLPNAKPPSQRKLTKHQRMMKEIRVKVKRPGETWRHVLKMQRQRDREAAKARKRAARKQRRARKVAEQQNANGGGQQQQ
ncbi:hypothetical protein JCM10213_006724 [Rhodosporidiobolus nylandii]